MLAILLADRNEQSVSAQGPLGYIRQVLQNNIAGAPVVHKHTEWDFDPEISQKRRQQFYEVRWQQQIISSFALKSMKHTASWLPWRKTN